MEKSFLVKRIDDKSLYEIFDAARAAGQAAIESVASEGQKLFNNSPMLELAFNTGLPWKASEDELASEAGQYVLSAITLQLSLRAVDNRGGGSKANVAFKIIRGGEDTLVDRFTIRRDDNFPILSDEGAQQIQKSIHKSISVLLQPVAPEDGGLIPTLSNLSEAFSRTYQRISTELSDAVAATRPC